MGDCHIIIQNVFQPNTAAFLTMNKQEGSIDHLYLSEEYLYIGLTTDEELLIYEIDLYLIDALSKEESFSPLDYESNYIDEDILD